MIDMNQGRPLDVLEQWKLTMQGNTMIRSPGFSCQFLKEDDAEEKDTEGDGKSFLFRVSSDKSDPK